MSQENTGGKTLTIGVPVYNEERSLPSFFENLVHAVKALPRNIDVEVIFCVNGCEDGSEALLKEQTRNSSDMASMRVIESEPGKMNAQMAIVENREFDGPICFADADIIMNPATLKSLYEALEKDDDCQVSYAKVEPFYDGLTNGDDTAFNDLLFTHYKYREHQPERSYFHGRTFMLRDDSYLRDVNIDLDERVQRVRDEENPWYVEHLGLNKGPLIDDIYLSRAIVADHGAGAITKVDEAKIHFHPPTSIDDYSRVLERTAAEIKRLDLLFPEHAHLQESVFQRQFNDAKLFMPQGERLKYRMLKDLERTLTRHIESSLVPPDEKDGQQFGVAHWLTAGTTKREYGKDQLALFQKPYGGSNGLEDDITSDQDEGPPLH